MALRSEGSIDTSTTGLPDFLPEHTGALLARPPDFRAVVGPLAIELHASSRETARVASEALAHARSDEPRAHRIRIALLDSRDLCISPPPVSPGTEHLRAPEDEVVVRHKGRIVAVHKAESRMWQTFDSSRRLGIVHAADAARISRLEWSAPFRYLLEWATEARPYGLLHGAVLARADGEGVLLAAGSGAGKSTTTAAAVLRGLKTAGDDMVLVEERADGSVAGYAVYDSLKIAAPAASLLKGALVTDDTPVGPGCPKHLLRLRQVRPDALINEVNLRAILLPRLAGGQRTTIRPAGKAEAFRALGPTSAWALRVTPGRSLERASRIARRVPAHALELSNDPFEVAATIESFLEELR